MQLVSAEIGPFRSINGSQKLKLDPAVTVLVGMNEAGKTVLLKALEKTADALGQKNLSRCKISPAKICRPI